MKQKKSRKKLWLTITFSFLAVLVFGGSAYAYMVYHSVHKAINTMHHPVKRDNAVKREKEVTIKKRDPFSILLLGVDQREHDKGRSDTMIVLTVNPNKKSIDMLSIPRDTRTEIVGKGTVDKINHAYAFGDVEMSMNTVEHFLNIPIDYYIKVNMEGFKDLVDAVDGVTVNNDLAFSAGGQNFPVGQLHLNGEQALKYSRMRHDDPRGDFGRQKRQREIIDSILDKGASISSLWNYNDIMDALAKNVKTNLSFQDMVDIQSNYKDLRHNINEMQISGDGQIINDVWYYIVPESERLAISKKLRDHLQLDGQHGASIGESNNDTGASSVPPKS
ncbi:LytR family transcriptional regulator [Bacillus sp. FJAT-49736]|uniref:polyisoprenyl-teichoic acid--peptidoglycan teichoic acid transferase TagU n=1 Tax=Bacillus sp. FJAT-49736 TaxID=2833582 RepID=UPI001BCA22C5|nr:LytR family transcriptional regulator [Bacillus sp. FJAT-49736]MBS4174329.1 LytR family transcriptional regulator [Bacillus sp. FJAT-49736]